MKKLLMIFALILVASPAAAQLVITGVYDGPLSGGTPKGVELFACSDIADLSVYGLGSANNGGGTDGVEFFFPADAVTAGTSIYVAYVTSANPTFFFDFFGFDYDYLGGQAVNINGDDAIELFLVGADQLGTEVVDLFGDIDTDGSGTPWEHLDGWAKRNSATGPSPVFDVNDWTFSGINVWDGASDNASSDAPFAIGGYECGSVSTESGSWDSLKSMYR